jgi:diketogulonate reductase-like aldo/keto reductase
MLNVGKCRAIGVSNYNEQHLTELLSSCEIKPMVNQVQHVYKDIVALLDLSYGQ